jgi:phenylacetate-CoA ligase
MLPAGLLRAFVFPIAERLSRTRFWTYYKDSLRFEHWAADRRQPLRDGRMAEVWNAALDTSLHRQRLADAGLSAHRVRPDDVGDLLPRLPPVGKPAFRRLFPHGVTRRGRETDWRYSSTAGTTDRMTVITDFCKRDHSRSSELRALRLALGTEVGVNTVEIPPNACNIVCGLIDTGPPSLFGYLWQAVCRGKLFSREALTELRGRFERRVVMQVHTLPPIAPMPVPELADTLDRYLEQIGRLRPVLLRGFPVYLSWLADRCSDRGAPPGGLHAVSPYGGLASPAMVERIARGLGCRFVQKYGTSELSVVAASCGRSPGMHVLEDLFHVELLRRGRPVAPGELGRVVVTDLINTAMPLIRYDLGDVGRLHVGPCPCGRRTGRLEVLGRSQEVLESPSGVLTASAIADTVFCDRKAGNFRLEEVAPGAFEAAIVAGVSGGTPDLAAWRERFAALHGAVRRLRVRLVPFVEPEASGKYRFILPRATDREVL